MKDNEREKAILISVDTGNERETELSADELERLADTAGADTVAVMIQRRETPSPATYIGRGKIDELKKFLENNEADILIADDELTGTQIKNLEKETDLRVLDRTTLILDIFASRARSSEGRLQVELAQLKYNLPRLTGSRDELSRLGGGIGTRGPGESKLETDKRHIKRRITHIEELLKEADRKREVSARSRRDGSVPTCALIGYTNAGKSTLMNALCGTDIYAEDKLFATLDPTVRRLSGNDGDILMVDTVGFIRKLPHELVNSFRSTLEESLSADLLLNVTDASDTEAERHMEIVASLLSELGASGKPIISVMNKCDREIPSLAFAKREEGDNSVFYTSAKTGEGVEELRSEIIKRLHRRKEYKLLIPYSDGAVASRLYGMCDILSSEHTEDGTLLHVKAFFSEKELNEIKKYILS